MASDLSSSKIIQLMKFTNTAIDASTNISKNTNNNNVSPTCQENDITDLLNTCEISNENQIQVDLTMEETSKINGTYSSLNDPSEKLHGMDKELNGTQLVDTAKQPIELNSEPIEPSESTVDETDQIVDSNAETIEEDLIEDSSQS